jgi:hypothetical protein
MYPTAAATVPLDTIVRRIEKLWRKASSAAVTDAERTALEAKALALMERHRIEAAMLDIERDDPLGDHTYGVVQGRYGRVTLNILDAVAESYDCRMYWKHRPLEYEVHLVGFRTDAERARQMGHMLVTGALTEAARVRRRTPGATMSARHSFLAGFADAIAHRLRLARQSARAESRATYGDEVSRRGELVLVSRQRQVADAMASHRVRPSRRPDPANEIAYCAGASAGYEASLSPVSGIGAPAARLARGA